MSLCGHHPDGYYDDNGEWQRTKFCFVFCGARCTCMPPGGQHYSPAHDKRTGAARGSPFSIAGSRSPNRGEPSDEMGVSVEATNAPPKST